MKKDRAKMKVSPEKAAKIRFAKIVANLISPIVVNEGREKHAVTTAHQPTPAKRTLTKYEEEQRQIRRDRKARGLYAL